VDAAITPGGVLLRQAPDQPPDVAGGGWPAGSLVRGVAGPTAPHNVAPGVRSPRLTASALRSDRSRGRIALPDKIWSRSLSGIFAKSESMVRQLLGQSLPECGKSLDHKSRSTPTWWRLVTA
jgi:hypothetical protein